MSLGIVFFLEQSIVVVVVDVQLAFAYTGPENSSIAHLFFCFFEEMGSTSSLSKAYAVLPCILLTKNNLAHISKVKTRPRLFVQLNTVSAPQISIVLASLGLFPQRFPIFSVLGVLLYTVELFPSSTWREIWAELLKGWWF